MLAPVGQRDLGLAGWWKSLHHLCHGLVILLAFVLGFRQSTQTSEQGNKHMQHYKAGSTRDKTGASQLFHRDRLARSV